MRWQGDRESDNVEDQRSISPRQLAVAGGGIGTIIFALIYMFLGGDPQQVLNQVAQPGQTQSAPSPQEEERKKFVSVVLADTEDVWTMIFKQQGGQYRFPKLVLFRNQVQSACGGASSSMGPFYCGEDEKVYIDLAFYDELKTRFGSPGDFAQAYVVAHEVGHHVQKLLGTMDKVHGMRSRMSEKDYNKLSVRLELQADFYAGVWAHHAQKMKNLLDPKDIDDGIRAATAIGDDTLQKQAQGYVVPDAFTHGSSEQRVRWFRKGWESGDLKQGDTFGARDL